MADTSTCARCSGIEDLQHKFISCQYVKKIWDCARTYLDKLQDNQDYDPLKSSLAATLGSNTASMTYTAEILQNILYLNPAQTYLIHPKAFVTRALKNLIIKEGNSKIRRTFIEALNETNRD